MPFLITNFPATALPSCRSTCSCRRYRRPSPAPGMPVAAAKRNSLPIVAVHGSRGGRTTRGTGAAPENSPGRSRPLARCEVVRQALQPRRFPGRAAEELPPGDIASVGSGMCAGGPALAAWKRPLEEWSAVARRSAAGRSKTISAATPSKRNASTLDPHSREPCKMGSCLMSGMRCRSGSSPN